MTERRYVRENTWLEDKRPSTHEAEQQKARRGFSSRFRCKPHDMRVTWGGGRVARTLGRIELFKLARISDNEGGGIKVGLGHLMHRQTSRKLHDKFLA